VSHYGAQRGSSSLEASAEGTRRRLCGQPGTEMTVFFL
jgi:hypothetical protein